MTMVTAPLAVLIGVAVGMLTSGAVFAVEDNAKGEYVVGTIFCCILFTLVCFGSEALIKLGGA